MKLFDFYFDFLNTNYCHFIRIDVKMKKKIKLFFCWIGCLCQFVKHLKLAHEFKFISPQSKILLMSYRQFNHITENIIIRNGRTVWKVSRVIECYLRLNLSPENTSTQTISAYIKCKHWMSRKVRMVKTTVYFIFDQLLGALIHLNFIILILVCF